MIRVSTWRLVRSTRCEGTLSPALASRTQHERLPSGAAWPSGVASTPALGTSSVRRLPHVVGILPERCLLGTVPLKVRFGECVFDSEPRQLSRPEAPAGHTSLARLVAEIRRTTGDPTRQPRFVRTVHSFGYAFSGEATALEAPMEPNAGAVFPCSVLRGAQEIGLLGGDNVIGRAPDSRLQAGGPGAGEAALSIVP